MSNEYHEEYDPIEYAAQLGYTDELTRSDFTDPTVERAKTEGELRMSRLDLLVKGGVSAAAVAGLGSLAGTAAAAPAASGKFSGTLRCISLGVEWASPRIQQEAEKALGFKFNIQLMGTNAQVQKSITDPESFDVGGLYNYQFFQILPTGNFSPVDTRKLKAWKKMYPHFTRGKDDYSRKGCTFGQGNAPFRVMFVDPDGSTGLPLTKEGPKSNKQIVQWINEQTGKPIAGKAQPRFIVGPPAHFNYDSMGYNGDILTKRPEQVSWGELLNAKWKGRVALLNDPGIVVIDTGAAVQALGLMKFKNLGNMTRKEIDRLVKILTKYKKDGQFRAFWATFAESTNLMASGEVVIESMWSPAVAALVAQGINCRYAYPKEGMRGWNSAQGLPTHVTKNADKLQAWYDYANWTHAGFMGAEIMRQGYYVATGNQLPAWINSAAGKAGGFSKAEYDFWYLGKAAPRDLAGITGQVGDIKKGQVRDGGSLAKRSCKVSAWNSFFTENVYQLKRFNEFLSS